MEQSSANTVRARQLGATLKESRQVAGMPGDYVARKLGVSVSKISRLESGHRSPKLEDVAGMLALYGVTGKAREDLLKLCIEAQSGETGWWQHREMSKNQRTLIQLESAATQIVNYTPLLLPGLLQTGEYTRAVFRDVMLYPDDESEERMVTRLARHSVLMRDRPPHLLAVIYEPALRLPIGGPGVHERQLNHLVQSAQRPHITLHVVPESAGGHPGLLAGFTLLESADAKPVIFLDDRTYSLFLEEKSDLDAYNAALERLLTITLSPRESVDFIADLARAPGRCVSASDECSDGHSPSLPSVADQAVDPRQTIVQQG
jgi:transcriptional regulator with XRE-family HTH domain